MSVEMKTLTVKGTTFEIVDGKSRDILKNEVVTTIENATDNTKFAIGGPEQSIEVPTMEEFENSVLCTAQSLTEEQQAQARENIGAADVVAVNELKDDLDELRIAESGYFTNENEGSIFTVEDGKYTNGNMVQSLSTYRLFQMTADKDFTFYCGEDCTDSKHLFICIFNDSIASANCVAKYANDGKEGLDVLPTESSKAFVSKGQILTISYYRTETSPSYFRIATSYISGDVYLSDNVGLGKKSKEEVATMIDVAINAEKKKYIQYTATTTSSSTEEANIYIPTVSGYIKYKFIHTVNEAKNTNLWRIEQAYICDDSLSKIRDITTNGEWEFVFSLYGRPTGSSHFGSGFIGGKQHGNEVADSTVFIIDGVTTDITTLTEMTVWNTLEIYQHTTMYDSQDNTTPACYHGSNHIFNDMGVVIKQSVNWLIESQMGAAYLAMFPVSKDVSDTIMVDTTWQQESAKPSAGTSIRHNGAKAVYITKASEGFIWKFFVTEYPEGLDADGDYFLCTDNTTDYSGSYNKCYFTVTSNKGGHTVHSGDLWVSETHYELKVSN